MRFSGKQIGQGLAAILVVAAVGSGIAWYSEARESEQEHQVLSSAKLSLAQAIDKATATAGGQAISAKLKSKDGALVYKVVLLNGAQRSEVRIDAQSGASLGVKKEDSDE
ncbi:PepSY domain-containing protein [Neisseriaceae bacterium JH1-16]|nr:PepSY domain-containing protein [Neisseriaceae bacterium JH1-16]